MKKTGMPPFLRETGAILLMAVFLALVYNYFSAKPLPLIRVEPVKVATADSLLFNAGRTLDTAKINSLVRDAAGHRPDSTPTPLQKKALANPDSIARVAAREAASLFKTVTLQQVRRMLGEHRTLFFDARTPEEFGKGHIRGSRNIPGEDLSPHFPELAIIPRDTLIVVYCNGPLCNLGRELAQFLQTMEFTHVFLYDGGWEEWDKEKLAADSTVTARGGS
jgi:rhodanese-related sulfurtransferase